MIDHRRLQRALFRLQLDEALATRVFAGAAADLDSLALSEAEVALLTAGGLAGVTADPGGRRRTQVLANASSEFTLSLAVAARLNQAYLQVFSRSPELHKAIRDDEPLPFAFASYARRIARSLGEPALEALVDFEEALARVRRAHRGDSTRRASTADLDLPLHSLLIPLPVGVFGFAEGLRLAIDRQQPLPVTPGIPPAPTELVLAVPRPAESVHLLAEVHAERLQPPTDELFRRIAGATAERPFDAAERARFAREQGAEPEDLEAFVDTLVSDGLLVRR